MDSNQFRAAAHEMIDYVIDYMDNIKSRPVLPSVEPGYIQKFLPAEAPEHSEPWEDIFKDVERVIMPGVTHWHHPNFHAYFPTGNSWPSILADILSDSISCIGFSWIASPACTELEVIMLDWLGKLLALPECFLSSASGGVGGGVIQTTASEASLVALLSARTKFVKKHKSLNSSLTDHDVMGKLVAYTSDQAHSSIERATMLGGVQIRSVETDDNFSMRGDSLKKVIEEDKAKGLIPFFQDIMPRANPANPVAEMRSYYAYHAPEHGSAFICPEYRHLLNGVEFAESFNFNPHKWLLVQFDCSAMWLKHANDVVDAFNVDPLYLKHDKQGQVPDYRHWQIPLGRRFRSLKLWFVFRTYGAEGLRAHIRKQISLANEFAKLVRSDDRFEIPVKPQMGLVCFRLKGPNELSENLLKHINDRKKVHMVPSKLRGTYIIRFAVCSRLTETSDIELAWNEIKSLV